MRLIHFHQRVGRWLVIGMAVLVLMGGRARAENGNGPSQNIFQLSDTAPQVKVGRYRAAFTEPSPLSDLKIVLERGASKENRIKTIYAIKQMFPDLGNELPARIYSLQSLTFEVYVPEDYDGSMPYGLMVWMPQGKELDFVEDWFKVLKKYKMILVAPNDAGKGADVLLLRIPCSLDALQNMMGQYRIDIERLYTGGISNGGRVASRIASQYADVFRGGYFMIGCNPPQMELIQENMGLVGPIRSRNRYVLMTGDDDFNMPGTKEVHRLYQRLGARNATYMQVPKMGHEPPSTEWFEKGLVRLDMPLMADAVAKLVQAVEKEKIGKLGDALDIYDVIVPRLIGSSEEAQAKDRRDRLRGHMQQQIHYLTELIQKKELKDAAQVLSGFKAKFGKYGQWVTDRFDEEMKKAGGAETKPADELKRVSKLGSGSK